MAPARNAALNAGPGTDHLPTPGNVYLGHGVRSGSGCCSRSHFMGHAMSHRPL
jgi:hypothetical protein